MAVGIGAYSGPWKVRGAVAQGEGQGGGEGCFTARAGKLTELILVRAPKINSVIFGRPAVLQVVWRGEGGYWPRRASWG
jgi:hypothetical protein